jgi:presenilin-like A22 family membrane protease
MRHSLKLTIILIVAFLISQLIGLAVISSYDHYFGKTHEKIVNESIEKGLELPEQPDVTVIQFTPPPVETNNPIDIVKVIVNVLVAIVLGILFFFLLAKIGIVPVLKGWFAIVIFLCLSIAFTLLLYPLLGMNLFTLFGLKLSLAEIIAVPLAFVIMIFKVFKRHFLVHNISELFVYPGFAIVLLPILNVVTATALLLAISIYDIVAVWRSDYMVNLARFQVQKVKIFAGFFIPYVKKEDRAKIVAARKMMKQAKNKKLAESKLQKIKVRVAALGGGDVAIPMLFLGAVFLAYGLSGYFVTLAFTIASLAYLLFTAKDKAYPAMPFLSVGALVGFLVFLFVKLIFGF